MMLFFLVLVLWLSGNIIKSFLTLFSRATDMDINVDKSSFLYNNIDEVDMQQISNFMPYKMEPITTSFK